MLLDTHALIWARTDPTRLSAETREQLTDPTNAVLASAVNVWEISVKVAAGRLARPVGDIARDLAERGVDTLPVTPAHAWVGGQLPPHHRDPFDRLLVAQAQLEGLTIVTGDPKIARYQVAILRA